MPRFWFLFTMDLGGLCDQLPWFPFDVYEPFVREFVSLLVDLVSDLAWHQTTGLGGQCDCFVWLDYERSMWNKSLSDFQWNISFSCWLTRKCKKPWKENLAVHQKSLRGLVPIMLQLYSENLCPRDKICTSCTNSNQFDFNRK